MSFGMRYVFYFAFIAFHALIGAEVSTSRPKVCLNMIVKDESQVICRCLNSVLPLIDYWVIVDTGSTDGTQQKIKEFMQSKNKPGELFERPWVNFGHNRNEALQLAKGKGDYVLFIDADEYFEYDPDFVLPRLDKDAYEVEISHAGSRYSRTHLINNAIKWEWVGVLHEVVMSSEAKNRDLLKNIVNIYTTEGARSKDPEKYLKDAKILEDALQKEPGNARYVFYLAQSYRDAGKYALALDTYEKRVKMGGWDEEVFFAMYQVGCMQEILQMPDDEIIRSFNRAYQFRKSRIEPLYHIVRLLNAKKDFAAALNIGKLATALPKTSDVLFVQQWMADYGIPLELSVCAYWNDDFAESQRLSIEILKNKSLPNSIRQLVEKNLEFANGKLLEKSLQQYVNIASD